jgi:ABC-type glycerol-3-phosphate transport system permease component
MQQTQSYQLQKGLLYAGAYAVLLIFGFFILFPFMFMFFTSFKAPDDVFRSPPRLLPYEATTTDLEGEPRPLYNVEVDGQRRQLILVDEGSPIVRFASAENPDQTFERAPRDAKPVGGFANQESATIAGQERKLWEIEEGGQTKLFQA